MAVARGHFRILWKLNDENREMRSSELMSVGDFGGHTGFYMAMYSMERKGQITMRWQAEGIKRPFRLYQITDAGRELLTKEQSLKFRKVPTRGVI